MLLYLTYLKKEYVTLFNRLFNFRAKRLGHISIKAKMCVLPLVSYDDKTETLDYGQCFTIDVISMSLNSMTVRHNDVLKKGNILAITIFCFFKTEDKAIITVSLIENSMGLSPGSVFRK